MKMSRGIISSSVGSAVLLTVVACHGSRTTPPPSPELHVAPLGASSASATVSAGANPTEPTAPSGPEAIAEADRPPGDTCGLEATIRTTNADGYIVTLANKGSRPVRLVVPGDGSEAGMRTPILTWIATEGGKPAEPAPAGRCGFTNEMTVQEVFTLAPGASREMKDWVGQPYVKPGTYDLKLRFRNDPKQVRNASPDVTKLVAATDACDVTSNSIRVTLP